MPDTVPSLDEKKRRAQRSRAIALGLAAFVAIVFIVTILKISGNIGGAAP